MRSFYTILWGVVLIKKRVDCHEEPSSENLSQLVSAPESSPLFLLASEQSFLNLEELVLIQINSSESASAFSSLALGFAPKI